MQINIPKIKQKIRKNFSQIKFKRIIKTFYNAV